MKITLLGTGTSQGVPVIACKCKVCSSEDRHDKRLRSSVLVEAKGLTLVIDTGPDFRQQMLREHVNEVNAILFTHEHKDHIAGLDDVRAFNYVLQKPMDIYCEEKVHEALKREFSYAFAERKYPGVPQINVYHIDSKPFVLNGIEVVPIRGYHHKLPVLGFRIGDFSYLTDLNHIPAEEMPKLTGTKILVITALRKEKHVSHFNLEEALEAIHKIDPEQAYLTHISHQFGLHAIEDKALPENVHLGYDGLKIQL
ncbi:MAG: MBL fold metallo-hydrolase [Bacteroidetes bacterium]|nr:MBL fold metallo-hydrolase [Bacteroidota bacterium]